MIMLAQSQTYVKIIQHACCCILEAHKTSAEEYWKK